MPVDFGNGSVNVAPILLKSPGSGNGLIAAGGYLSAIGEDPDTSFFGAAVCRRAMAAKTSPWSPT